MNQLYFGDCLDVLKEFLNCGTVRLPGLGEMLTFKSATKRLDKVNGEEGLF